MSLNYRDARIPDSPVSRWDGRWKLAALVLAAVACSLLSNPWPTGAAVVLALVVALLARIPASVLVGRLMLLGFGLIPVWLVLPFTAANGTLTATTLSLRLLAIGTLGLVLLRSAPLPVTLAAAHRLYVPGVLIQIAQLAYRYAFLFFDEARRLRVALKVRGFRARTSAHTYRTTGHSVGTLLVRGGDRAERVADAMRCRGFDGHFHCLHRFETTAADVFAFMLLTSLSAALVCWDVIG